MTSNATGRSTRPISQAALRVGQFCLDIPSRHLRCLNETARQLYEEGLPLTGNDATLANLRDPDGAEVTANHLPLVITARTKRPSEAIFLLVRPGQPDLHVYWSAAPITDAEGKVVSVLATVVCRPPPPNWQALAGVAHDLATPLNTMGLLLNLPGGPAAEPGNALGLLRAAHDRAQQIGRDLLEWCRTAGLGGRAARPAWFAPAPLLRQLLAEQQPAADQKKLTLSHILNPARGWEIHTDRVWFGRIFANLLANAVRYTPAGGQVQLTAAWEDRPGEQILVVSIIDTGAGISPEEQESIFHPFERGQTGRESGSLGSGIGLAVVDHLTQELGLRRDLVSRHGYGSAFRVIVPAHLLRPGTDTPGPGVIPGPGLLPPDPGA